MYHRDHKWLDSKWFLRVLIVATPLGFIAVETGWMVTEVGRQPWIIYGVMRTSEAVTSMPGLVVPFITFTVLYIFLLRSLFGCCSGKSYPQITEIFKVEIPICESV